MTRPDGKAPSMKVKITGIQANIVFCTGSVGSGFIFIWKNIDTPMISGQMPSARKWQNIGSAVGSQGISPNKVKTLVGSGADRSLIQPKNGAWRISMVMKITL